MAAYPGQRPRRAPAVALVAVLVALGVGVAIGWAAFGRDTTATKAQAPLCPGSQHDALERAHAAACLLDDFLALINQPARRRNAQLAEIVSPARLADLRDSYPALGTAPVNGPGQPPTYAKVTAEYSVVAAVKAGAGPNASYQAPAVAYTAWVAVVISTADGSAPGANWYLGDFAVRWQDDRWWLTDSFHVQQNASPVTYGGARSNGFGPGWVGV